jgi:serine/threonine-protein kinase ATR
LPHLVLAGQIDVIGRITQARGEKENLNTCMEPSNFAPILALLIVQNIPDVEALTTSVLRAVSPLFRAQDMDFTDWMRTDPAGLGLRLLRVAGQVPDNMKPRVSRECVYCISVTNGQQIHLAFRLLATHSPPASQKATDAVVAFLSHHILGFMARFSEVVNDVQNQYSVIEKIRCIKGVEEMIKIGKKAIKVARPQVSSIARLETLFAHTSALGLRMFASCSSSERAPVGCILRLATDAYKPRRRRC